MRFEHLKHEVEVETIYRVGKLKKESSYSKFNYEIQKVYLAAKTYPPEDVILTYTNKDGAYVKISLKESEEKGTCKTIKAIVAVGSCINMARNDVDRSGLCEILCLGQQKPSLLLSNRGDIFSSDSSTQINCRRVCDLMHELLK